MEELYYIQNGYIGNAILWWAKDSKGYTTNFKNAGKFTWAQAEDIIKRPEDRAWPCKYIDEQLDAQIVTVDAQYLSTKYRIDGNLE
jgi:hypothetical protein